MIIKNKVNRRYTRKVFALHYLNVYEIILFNIYLMLINKIFFNTFQIQNGVPLKEANYDNLIDFILSQ